MANTITAGNSTNGGTAVASDTSGTLSILTGSGAGTTAIAVDASQNVGVGTTSPNTKLDVVNSGTTSTIIQTRNGTVSVYLDANNAYSYLNTFTNHPMLFGTNNAERMRVDTSGNLLISSTSMPSGDSKMFVYMNAGDGTVWQNTGSTGASAPVSLGFLNSSGTRVGFIAASGTGVAFTSTSDYRLKENIQPMVGALEKVSQLKPCTYKWKSTGGDGQGFIAHELQAIVPDCVTGEKDAVDAEGNPSYQGVDTSFLVATLTAAIQELKAELDALKAKVGE